MKYIAPQYDVEVSAHQVPDEIRFDVPARNQGQIVEVAYGTFDRAEAGPGDPYQRISDASDGSVKYFRLTQAHRWVDDLAS